MIAEERVEGPKEVRSMLATQKAHPDEHIQRYFDAEFVRSGVARRDSMVREGEGTRESELRRLIIGALDKNLLRIASFVRSEINVDPHGIPA